MLTCVTITGADDGVDVVSLATLSREYPFVEWGILMSVSRAGTPRYPSRPWMIALENMAKMSARFQLGDGFVTLSPERIPLRLSAHFCGEVSRDAMYGKLHDFPVIERVERIQLNGWEPRSDGGPDYGTIAFAKRMPCYEIILQVRDGDVVTAAHDAEAMGDRASILHDPSGGTGKREDFRAWPLGCGRRRTVKLGYAGGLGPDNVAEVAEGFTRNLVENGLDADFWLDMETGVRTDDAFDLEKVRAVLERVKPFVGGAK